MGIITTPGKFEGEPSWVPVVWSMVLDGASDDEFADGDTPVSVFHIDADLVMHLRNHADVDPRDVETLTLGSKLLVWEDSNGFVYAKVMGAKKLERFMQECEEENGEEEMA